MKICSLGSGSSGNCILVSSEKAKILIDIGLSLSRVERCLKALGMDGEGFNILLTHTHYDHVSGLVNFMKHHDATVYVNIHSADTLLSKYDIDRQRVKIFSDEDFFIQDITVSSFKVNHDVPCVGYSLYSNGRKVSIATDLGKMTGSIIKKLSCSDLVVIEANHDENLVRASEKYSEFLKKRILGEKGHLSNETCGKTIAKLYKTGVRQFILAHLSKENNYPELAFDTVCNILHKEGIEDERDVHLEVALRDRMTSLYEIV